jgi:CubicO group peptidase (beta-lactamase class C family)
LWRRRGGRTESKERAMNGDQITASFSGKRLDRLRRALEGYVERGEVAGMVSMIHRRGTLVRVDAIGWQDREERLPMRRDTLFRIASMTKPITAVAALTLVDDGRLRLHDPVNDWLPELAGRMVMRTRTARSTTSCLRPGRSRWTIC